MDHVDLLITDVCVVTMDGNHRVISNGAVAIKGDRIAAIGQTQEVLRHFTGSRTINGRGKYLYPGFISTHTHLFQSMLKGLGRDMPLFEWLDSSVRRALRNFDEQTIYHAALVSLLDAVRSGTTTVTDFQYCHSLPGIDQAVIQAYLDLQVRGVLCKAHSDVGGFPPEIALDYVESEDDYFQEIEALCLKYCDHPLISLSLGPSIIWDHDRAGYVKTRAFANQFKIPISMHLVETEEDNRYAMNKWGMSAIDFLESCGILGPDFIVAHAVHVTENDIRRFRDYDVKISHCPVSNMLLASGTAPVPRYLKEGITVSLACDGAASNDTQDMLEVMRIAALTHKQVSCDASVMSAPEVLEMATMGGAKTLGMQKSIGSLEEGKMADLFIWSANNARSIPVNDPISSIVYSSNTDNIETTIIAGKIVLDNGKVVTLDEQAVLQKAQNLAENLVHRSRLGNSHWGKRLPTTCGIERLENGGPRT
jgi:5-methylthioadenosine/S-adenosylhomocysteine deaminase